MFSGIGQTGNNHHAQPFKVMFTNKIGIIGYYVAVEIVEPGTGYQVHCQYTDDLGNVVDQYSATGDGGSNSVVSGEFFVPTNDNKVEILLFGSDGNTLTYRYKVAGVSM